MHATRAGAHRGIATATPTTGGPERRRQRRGESRESKRVPEGLKRKSRASSSPGKEHYACMYLERYIPYSIARLMQWQRYSGPYPTSIACPVSSSRVNSSLLLISLELNLSSCSVFDDVAVNRCCYSVVLQKCRPIRAHVLNNRYIKNNSQICTN